MSLFTVRTVPLMALCAGLFVFGAACRSGSRSDDAADPAVATEVDASDGAVALDAGAPPEVDPGPEMLPATVRAVTADATVELLPGEPNVDVSPESRFEVEMPRLADVRVRLFDEGDRLVPSNDKLELAGQTARYVLVPAEPLITGTRYALIIDGLRGELASDSNGKEFAELRIELKTPGEKPQPQKPAKKPSRRRR